MVINLDDKLFYEIEKFCKINNITNIENEIQKFVTIGFNCERFGNTPFIHMSHTHEVKTENDLKQLIERTQVEDVKPSMEQEKIDIPLLTEEVKEERVKTGPIVKPKKKVKIIKND